MPREMPESRSKRRDKEAEEFGKAAAKKFGSGTHTASETGAEELAERRNPLEAAMGRSNRKRLKKGIARSY